MRILTDLFCCEKAGLLHTGDGVPELEDYLRYYGIADGNFVIEVLPANKAEREVRLAALRTEIMAGGGPDVFVMRCDVPNRIINDWNFLENEHPEESTLYREPLFTDVTAAMNNSFFLPLDKYLEKAKYFRSNFMEPVILDAGKSAEGQMVLPITITFPYAVYRKADLQKAGSMPDSWQKSLIWEDSAVRKAYGLAAWNQFSDLFGKYSNYDTENLTFSREELLARVKEAIRLKEEELSDIENDVLPSDGFDGLLLESELEYMSVSPWSPGYYDARQTPELHSQVIAPIRNVEGGVTAGITSYACINRNTERSQEAFDFLDLLFLPSTQSFIGEYDSNGKNHQTILLNFAFGVPAGKDMLFDSKHSFGQRYISEIGIDPGPNEEAFSEYTALRNEVTNTRFYGTLDVELQTMYEACLEAESDKEIEKIVSKAYDTMLMILAES